MLYRHFAYVTIVLSSVLTSCGTSPADTFAAEGFKSVGRGYNAIDPIQLRDNGVDGKRDPDLETLTSIGTVTSQHLVSGDVTLTTPVGGVNGDAESVRLYSDNLIYRIVVKNYPIKSSKEREFKVPVSLVVGVGSRIEGLLKRGEGKIDLNGIPGFGIVAGSEIKSASASVHTIGILSKTLVKMPRFSGELTKENLYVFFQNLALINSEIYEPGTSITPHIMGFYVSEIPEGIELSTIASAIRYDAGAAESLSKFYATEGFSKARD